MSSARPSGVVVVSRGIQWLWLNQPRALAPLRAFRLAGKKVGQPPRFQILTENHARKGFFAVKLPSGAAKKQPGNERLLERFR